MTGNLWGVDINLDQDNKPHCIEINGFYSGLNGFHQAYGDNRAHKKLMQEMKRFSDAKPIYIPKQYTSPLKLWALAKSLSCVINPVTWIAKHYDIHPSIYQVMTNKSYNEFKESAKAKKLWESSYLDIAIELGIDLRTYCSCSEKEGVITFDGNSKVLKEDVGLILGSIKGKSLDNIMANSNFHEELSLSKLMQAKILDTAGLQEHVPRTKSAGFGLYTRNPSWIKNAKLCVYKPNHGGWGKDVHVVSPDRLEEIFSFQRAKNAQKKFLTKAGEDINSLTPWLHLGTAAIQEFIPSKGFYSKITEKEHTGCIRSIVFDGTFIDAYNRLAPQPMGEGNESYVANLSRGASAQPINDKEKEIVSKFSENVVSAFESEINKKVRNRKQMNSYVSEYWKKEFEKVK